MTENKRRNLSLITRLNLYFMYMLALLICVTGCSFGQSTEDKARPHSESQARYEAPLERASTSSSHLIANRIGNKIVRSLEGKDNQELAESGPVLAQNFTPLEYPQDRAYQSTPYNLKASISQNKIIEFQENRARKVPVTILAPVYKLLPDDLKGKRHQRFLIKLANQTTVLVAHNIDLAPRVPCKRGDLLELSGEYIWNEKGGVLHYTHRSTSIRHQGGFIKFAGVTYQ